MSEFKFEIGNLVQVDPDAYDEQHEDWPDIARDTKTRIFPIVDRKVHSFDWQGEEMTTILYKLEGLNYQGSDGWIAEAWLEKRNGPIRIIVEIPKEHTESPTFTQDMAEAVAEMLGIETSAVRAEVLKFPEEDPIVFPQET